MKARQVAAILRARRSHVVVTVVGHSMSPTYGDGDRLLVRRGTRGITRGAVAVFRMPAEHADDTLDWLVKRVVAIPGDAVPSEVRAATDGEEIVPTGFLVVRGDNPRSLDSRQFGYVPVQDVLGLAVRRLL